MWACSLLLAACAPQVAPADPAPSCARAWEEIARSLRELHAAAGRPAPELPARATWVESCERFDLGPAQLRCLEPEVAAADPQGCHAALATAPDARAALEGSFRRSLGLGPG